MKRFRLVGVALALAIVGLFGLVAAGTPAASAATTLSAHVGQPGTAANAGVAVLKQCPIEPHRFRIYNARCQKIRGYTCFIGNHGDFRKVPVFASNGCEFRVWIYPARGEQGKPICINPKKGATHGLKRDYFSFRVSNNTADCPPTS